MMNLKLETNKIYCGNTLDVLKTFPDESINCCVTSPPYWALRDYGTDGVVWDGDPDCEHDFELETKITNNAVSNNSTLHDGKGVVETEKIKQMNNKSQVGFCNKCGAWKGQLGLEPDFNLYIKHLCDIFDEVKRVLRKDGTCWVNLGDTYGGTGDKGECKDPKYPEGRNGQQKALNRTVMQKSLCNIPSRFSIEMQNRGWIMRNKIIWHKPNCMPSSVTDRFTVDFEEIFFFVKNKKYWFEQQFEDLQAPIIAKRTKNPNDSVGSGFGNGNGSSHHAFGSPNENGRNKRTVWKIPTQPFPDAHFAVFPEKLVETPIKAGCPKDGVVLDPFMGSGTVALKALKENRRFVGIEINPKYIDMANERIRPLLSQSKLEGF